MTETGPDWPSVLDHRTTPGDPTITLKLDAPDRDSPRKGLQGRPLLLSLFDRGMSLSYTSLHPPAPGQACLPLTICGLARGHKGTHMAHETEDQRAGLTLLRTHSTVRI